MAEHEVEYLVSTGAASCCPPPSSSLMTLNDAKLALTLWSHTPLAHVSASLSEHSPVAAETVAMQQALQARKPVRVALLS